MPHQATFALFDAGAIERAAGDGQAARRKAKSWLTRGTRGEVLAPAKSDG